MNQSQIPLLVADNGIRNRMPKSACCYLFLAVCCVSCKPAEETIDKPVVETPLVQKLPSESYEEVLYELGAFPVSKLTKPYLNDGNPGQVYFMGRRVDVHGWLSPYWVRTDSYVTGITKAPLRYERYVEIMDVETYQKTKDPLLFAIIQFTLNELHWRKINIKNPEDILKVYHAKMGLDNDALWLLKRRELIDGPMIADLYRQYQDPLLFHYLIPPESGQGDYRVFLEQLLADQKIDAAHRFAVYTQLYQSDKKTNLAGYKGFIFQNIERLSKWHDRYQMNEALLNIGDEESTEVVNQSLLNDPVTEVREAILFDLKEQGRIDEFIETIHLLCLGKGKPCSGVSMNRRFLLGGESELSHELRDFLNWAKKKQNLKQETQHKIESALQALTIKRSQSKLRPKGDFVGSNDPSRDQ